MFWLYLVVGCFAFWLFVRCWLAFDVVLAYAVANLLAVVVINRVAVLLCDLMFVFALMVDVFRCCLDCCFTCLLFC